MRWAFLLVFVPVASLADPVLECTGASSQVEIGACVQQAEGNVNAAIETAYELAAQSARELDEVTGREVSAPALEAAQAAWSAYRDAQCEAVGASFGGGSGTGIAITACRIELGRVRVTSLLNLAN